MAPLFGRSLVVAGLLDSAWLSSSAAQSHRAARSRPRRPCILTESRRIRRWCCSSDRSPRPGRDPVWHQPASDRLAPRSLLRARVSSASARGRGAPCTFLLSGAAVPVRWASWLPSTNRGSACGRSGVRDAVINAFPDLFGLQIVTHRCCRHFRLDWPSPCAGALGPIHKPGKAFDLAGSYQAPPRKAQLWRRSGSPPSCCSCRLAHLHTAPSCPRMVNETSTSHLSCPFLAHRFAAQVAENSKNSAAARCSSTSGRYKR